MLETPKMFEQEQLLRILDDPTRYLFVLERACLQFEPDEHDYIRVSSTVYEHIHAKRQFDQLRSTRHFGPMTFYLANNKKIDLLLQDMIERSLLADASALVRLYCILNDLQFEQFRKSNDFDTVKQFVKSEQCASNHRHELELTLQKYQQSLQTSNRAVSI
jgi:small subunit ribosomal protein S22